MEFDPAALDAMAMWLTPRADFDPDGPGGGATTSPRNTSGFGGFGAATNNTQGMNLMFFNQIRFAGAKSVRTSTIILAVFNVIAAAATVLGILYDCYTSYKRSHPKFKFRRNGFAFVHSTEVFPLVLSCGITIQGTIFAVAQSRGLDDLNTIGCTLISQFMLPALFIVPYIQLVFGVEITMRGLRKKPFQQRGRWDVTLCLSLVGMLLLINFLVADFVRSGDFCFASLFWFVVKYTEGIFYVLLVIAAVLTVCTVLIFIKLSKHTRIDTGERIAASRMVYYQALAVISAAFMMPFFFFFSFNQPNNNRDFPEFQNQALTLSMVGTVVANVSGLMTGGLHLFLRSNTISTIKPKYKAADDKERARMKHRIKLWGPNRLEYADGSSHRMDDLSRARSLRRLDSSASLVSRNNKDENSSVSNASSRSLTYDVPNMNPLGSNAPFAPMVTPPQAAAKSPFSSFHSRKRSYNLFQGSASNKSFTMLPATTYSPNSANSSRTDVAGAFDDDTSTLKPPPSVRVNTGARHRRDSSMASSATVLFGLRLSHVEDVPPLQPKYFQPDAATIEPAAAQAKKVSPSPLSRVETAAIAAPQQQSASPTVDDDSGSEYDEPPRPGPVVANSRAVRKRNPVKDARMKTLPPVPKRGEPQESYLRDPEEDDEEDGDDYEDDGEEAVVGEAVVVVRSNSQRSQNGGGRDLNQITLSPTVYKPPQPASPVARTTSTKVTSPRGVGIPQRANTTAGSGGGGVRSPKQQYPPPRPAGSPRAAMPSADGRGPKAKGEWI